MLEGTYVHANIHLQFKNTIQFVIYFLPFFNFRISVIRSFLSSCFANKLISGISSSIAPPPPPTTFSLSHIDICVIAVAEFPKDNLRQPPSTKLMYCIGIEAKMSKLEELLKQSFISAPDQLNVGKIKTSNPVHITILSTLYFQSLPSRGGKHKSFKH